MHDNHTQQTPLHLCTRKFANNVGEYRLFNTAPPHSVVSVPPVIGVGVVGAHQDPSHIRTDSRPKQDEVLHSNVEFASL